MYVSLQYVMQAKRLLLDLIAKPSSTKVIASVSFLVLVVSAVLPWHVMQHFYAPAHHALSSLMLGDICLLIGSIQKIYLYNPHLRLYVCSTFMVK